MDSLKQLKTPLRYPGGKSRATAQLDRYFPHVGMMENFYEPFLGGGSVALYVTKKYPMLKVWVNDLYFPVYNFWYQLQKNPIDLMYHVMQHKKKNDNVDKAKKLFLESREILKTGDADDLELAIRFYIVNKCSFSGLTVSSGFSASSSEKNFTLKGIQSLFSYGKLIENWKITNFSYEKLLKKANKKTFVYLDPPYDIKDSLYGTKGNMHRGFDHDLFAEHCKNCDAPQLISYNYDEKVTNRFDGYSMDAFDLTYTMRSVGDYQENQKERKELVMYNYDIWNAF